MEFALNRAKAFNGPVIVHAITHKGHGYAPAEKDEADRFHGVGIIDPDTGKPVSAGGPSWTGAFADELVRIGEDRPDVVAITAAMLGPTGLDRFAERFPDRTYDVGIAEQHATTSAAGMAYGGLHPVVALYATFLNRAFDQVLMDCALHKAGVTFVLDRAGITGDDGASHNGMWDMSMLQIVPGLRIAAPRDEATLRSALREAVAVSDAPTVVRFPKGALGPSIRAVRVEDGYEVLAESGAPDVVIVSVGAFAPLCIDVAERLKAQGIGVLVVDPRWVKPVPAEPHRARRDVPARGDRRGRRSRGRGRLGRQPVAVRRRRRRAGADLRRARPLPRPRQARRGAGGVRPHRPGHLAQHRRDDGRPLGGHRGVRGRGGRPPVLVRQTCSGAYSGLTRRPAPGTDHRRRARRHRCGRGTA